MTHFAFSLDPETNDWHLDSSGNLAIVTDADAVAQHARQRVKTYQGEWFLDTEAGIPWIENILGRVYNPELAEALVTAEIVATDGVTGILGVSTSLSRKVRGLELNSAEITTIYGEANL